MAACSRELPRNRLWTDGRNYRPYVVVSTVRNRGQLIRVMGCFFILQERDLWGPFSRGMTPGSSVHLEKWYDIGNTYGKVQKFWSLPLYFQGENGYNREKIFEKEMR